MSIVLGAIADDFTGATDLCNTLVKEGMRVVQIIGVPGPDTEYGDAEAVVVALKTRTAPVATAVGQSAKAHDWLVANGARQVIEKYCSTFDSTPFGNIGPITDALLERSGSRIAVVCPAFPENGRTVYQGHLFVGAELLSESSMKDHPLTPMRDSSLVRLMEAQGDGSAGVIPLQTVRSGSASIQAALEELESEGVRYAVADAIEPDDLRAIGAAIGDHKLVTGGSGIAVGLPGNFRKSGLLGAPEKPVFPTVNARELVLAGSCSEATRGQIAAVRDKWPIRKIDADAVASSADELAELARWAEAQGDDTPILIHASADPDEVANTQRKYGVEQAGEMFEAVLSELAVRLTGKGFGKLVVAGGETSGAVVSALGIRALRIGPEIAPGVPWTETTQGPKIALALKSGNFGGERFFEEAFEVLP